ncbi:hypothetical protein EVAR_76093_1 [Eumeta japonica]|uniref:Uncharacterized protein n=1 Tax=Eumeta variegata TaxID=151549 RepID=A0A4C1W6S0_EUMVA|nr:hypothetical protein EVAR_76093_1 [Eumeta japonica]
MFSAPNKILTVEYWYQIFQFPGLEKFVNFLHFLTLNPHEGVARVPRLSAIGHISELRKQQSTPTGADAARHSAYSASANDERAVGRVGCGRRRSIYTCGDQWWG